MECNLIIQIYRFSNYLDNMYIWKPSLRRLLKSSSVFSKCHPAQVMPEDKKWKNTLV